MDPFIELMQAGALIMLLFAAVLILVVIKNLDRPQRRAKWGPAIIGVALVLFATPIYASVMGSTTFERFTPAARTVAALLLPAGLYFLSRLSQHNWRMAQADTDENGKA